MLAIVGLAVILGLALFIFIMALAFLYGLIMFGASWEFLIPVVMLSLSAGLFFLAVHYAPFTVMMK